MPEQYGYGPGGQHMEPRPMISPGRGVSSQKGRLRARPIGHLGREKDRDLTEKLKRQIVPGIDKEKFMRLLDETPEVARAILNSLVKWPDLPLGGE